MASGLSIALVLFAASPEQLHNAVEKAAPSIVRVTCGRARASAIVAGGSGEILAPTFCNSDTASVTRGEKEEPAHRVKSDAKLGLVLLQLDSKTSSAAPADARTLRDGTSIVAVWRGPKGITSAEGAVSGVDADPRLRLIDCPGPPGSGVFGMNGKLLGVTVGVARGHKTRVVPIATLRAWLSEKP